MYQYDVSIIIVSYNVKELLRKCLQSIYNNILLSCEVIVVDNASKDGSPEMVKSSFPQAHLITSERNLGFPAANNVAIKEAKGKYIILLNPDTEIIGNTLQDMVSYMENEQNKCNVLGPMLLNSDGTYQPSAWKFPTIFAMLIESSYLYRIWKLPSLYSKAYLSEPVEVDSISGAALLFRHSILEKLKGLDETLFWIEDIDFCYRAKQQGYKTIFFPKATIMHHSGKSAATNYMVSVPNKLFNKIKFYKKHHSILSMTVVILISAINALFKLIVFSALSPLKLMYRKKAIAYLYTLSRIFNPPKAL